MIEIRPAIDIIEGKCVRLTRGEYNSKRVYNESPLEVAKSFEQSGLKRVHVVDLDGAKEGKIINYRELEKIATRTSLKIDFGGGIGTRKDVEIAFECGVAQVTLGSMAARDKESASAILKEFGADRIILGADVKGERVMVRGWQEESGVFLFDLLREFQSEGARSVICTEISKDGALEGPAFDLYRRILEEVPGWQLIASGGVASVEDIEKLNDIGLYGVIIGKAIYEGRISIQDLQRFS